MADKLRRMKDRASRLYADGKLKDALELFERIVESEPRELTCRIKVGDILRKLGRAEEAVTAYEQVARRYAEDGLLLKAIAVCKLILVADPNHTATQAMLADLYARRRAGSPEVPALPVAPPPAGSVPADALSAWPSGVRVLDLEAAEDPSAAENAAENENGTGAVMSSWPMSQPVVVGDAPAQTWPIVRGQKVDDADEATLDIAVTEPVSETSSERTLELNEAVVDRGTADAGEETFRGAIDVAELGDEAPPAPASVSPPLIPLFSELPKRAFVEILVRMKMHQLRRGEVVIREGEDGDSFYVIASGLVSVSRQNQKGEEVRLAHLGEGAFFGEMALLQDGHRTATVRVEEDAQIFEISRDLLEEVIGQYPTVATAVRNFYRQRLLATAMATHALFAPFAPEERRSLMEQFKSRSFAPGEVMLEEGKKGNGLYLLLHGRVEVTRMVGGEPRVVAELSSGDIFGEMSLLTGAPTNATVTALEDAFVLRLSKKRFDDLVLSNGAVLEVVGKINAEREHANASAPEVVAHQLDARGAVLV